MSTSIDQSFVKQYESEVHEAYQRRGSLLRGTIRTKNNITGQSTTFQKVGKGSASTKTRHGVIPPMNIDHTPVECTLADYYAGDWVDKLDELKIQHDERRVTVAAGAYALGRKTDELIIAQLDSASTYSDSWDLVDTTLGHLTDAVTTLGARDVPLIRGEIFGVVSWQLWNKLLQIDAFTRSEYIGDDMPLVGATFRPRVWMETIWMPHSGLTINSSTQVRKNFIYSRDAIGHAIGAEVSTDITWHGDRAAHWVNNMMSQGAKLIDTEGVQQLLVDEDAT